MCSQTNKQNAKLRETTSYLTGDLQYLEHCSRVHSDTFRLEESAAIVENICSGLMKWWKFYIFQNYDLSAILYGPNTCVLGSSEHCYYKEKRKILLSYQKYQCQWSVIRPALMDSHIKCVIVTPTHMLIAWAPHSLLVLFPFSSCP